MFNLMPWKKRNHGGAISVRHAEPSREDLGYYPVDRFREEFDTLIDRFFGDRWFGRGNSVLPGFQDWQQLGWNLGPDWENSEKEYVLHAELPGFEPEDIDVNVSGKTLTVRAGHKVKKKEKNGGVTYQYGSFCRTFTLPHGVDESEINARYRNGVLTVHLPKTELGRGKRITVNAN